MTIFTARGLAAPSRSFRLNVNFGNLKPFLLESSKTREPSRNSDGQKNDGPFDTSDRQKGIHRIHRYSMDQYCPSVTAGCERGA